MNRAMSKVFIITVVLFVALVVNLTWIMGVRAQWFQDRPENKRSIAEEQKIKRGEIRGYDGTVIAGVDRRSGLLLPRLPQRHHRPATRGLRLRALRAHRRRGPVQRRAHGPVERPRRAELGGQAPRPAAEGGQPQAHAGPRRAEGRPAGAAGAEGRHRAARSQDGSPHRLGFGAHLRPREPRGPVGASQQGWQRAAPQPAHAGPVRARVVVQGGHRPRPALDTGKVTPDTKFVDTGTYVVFGGKVTNYGGEVFGPNDFTYALTASINTTFAKVGNLLGKKRLIAGRPALRLLPDAAAAAAGRRGRPQRALRQERHALAQRVHGSARRGLGGVRSGAGCWPLRCRWRWWPAGVANGGRVMKPYYLQEIVTADGNVVSKAQPEQWLRGHQGRHGERSSTR